VDDEPSEHDLEEGHPTHRRIPTWGDAIGSIVDANLASRTSDSGRGPHRGGRGRGGRGRGGR
jgi:hypothetical protein